MQSEERAARSFKYSVRFMHQNHVNLCGDSCLEMLLDFFDMKNNRSDNIQPLLSGAGAQTKDFEGKVAKYRKLAQDKRRDEAVSIFDKFLSAYTPSSLAAHFVSRTDVAELDRVTTVCAECRNKKQARDAQYGGGGFAQRWQRHKTKTQGFVDAATPDLFDRSLQIVKSAGSHEMRNNPRGIMEGIDIEEGIEEGRIQGLRNVDPKQFGPTASSTAEGLKSLLKTFGPVIAVKPFNKGSNHYILLTGIRELNVGFDVIYHDPWAGANKSVSSATMGGWILEADDKLSRRDVFPDDVFRSFLFQRTVAVL